MEIKVLGPGCAKCRRLYEEVEKAVSAAGISADLEKIEKVDDMIRYGIMITPALIVDGKLKSAGRVPRSAEIAAWLTSARSSP